MITFPKELIVNEIPSTGDKIAGMPVVGEGAGPFIFCDTENGEEYHLVCYAMSMTTGGIKLTASDNLWK